MSDRNFMCLSDEELERIVDEPPARGGGAEIFDHIRRCPRCALKFKALNSLRREAASSLRRIPKSALSREETEAFRRTALARLRELEEGRASGRAPLPRRRPVPAWALAAGLMIVAAAGFFAAKAVFRHQELYRSSGDSDLRLIEPAGRIHGLPAIFSWAPVKNAATYSISIVDENFKVILNAETRQSRFVPGPALLATLEPGKHYAWTITAHTADDVPITDAKGSFIIEAPAP